VIRTRRLIKIASVVMVAGLMCAFMLQAVAAGPGVYEKARSCYYRAISQKKPKQARQSLQKCATLFEKALDQKAAPEDRCHYFLGQIFHKLHDIYGKDTYFRKALFHYRTIVQKYHNSNLADDAQFLTGILYTAVDIEQAYSEFLKVVQEFPNGDMAERAQRWAATLKERIRSLRPPSQKEEIKTNRLATLQKVSHITALNYTRIVLYTNAPVRYQVHSLPPDKNQDLPPRLYIDLFNCKMKESLKDSISIMDGLLKGIRVGQFRPNQARVVLDIETIDKYKVFTLDEPYRIVIDVYGGRKRKQVPQITILGKDAVKNLPEQLGLHVKTIVIDPGHGGRDKGAIGPGGIYEKDITLAIAKKLKKLLEARTDCDVYLTRYSDVFVSLEKRTAIANAKNADLFISIHTNAHRDPRIGGIETYYLNFSTDQEAARVAALENAISSRKISDLEAILKDLLFVTKVNESSQLAEKLHHGLVKYLKRKYRFLRDLGVKRAPFYVLIGANMPSVLVEVCFITNKREAKLLRTASFQKRVAMGIASGVKDYIHTIEQIAKYEVKK